MQAVNPRPQSLPQILLCVCIAHGVLLEDLRGPSHASRFVQARRCAARALRARGLSLHRIGLLLHRHHTTILSLLQARDAAGEAE